MPHAPTTFDIELNLLLEAVYQKYQHDFRHYARASLRRRIRQAQERFSCPTVSRLQERVLHEPEVFAQMLQYFTVQVSEMFRDPAYFLALRRHVLPVLSTYPSIRIWVAGCSTGEEVWSLAILLAEDGLLERTHHLRDRHQPGGAEGGRGRHLRHRAHRRLQPRLPRGRRHPLAGRLLHRQRAWRAVRPVAAPQRGLRRP